MSRCRLCYTVYSMYNILYIYSFALYFFFYFLGHEKIYVHCGDFAVKFKVKLRLTPCLLQALCHGNLSECRLISHSVNLAIDTSRRVGTQSTSHRGLFHSLRSLHSLSTARSPIQFFLIQIPIPSLSLKVIQ